MPDYCTQCPVCGSSYIQTILEIRDIPLLCNVLLPTREAALGARLDHMVLGFCRVCSHFFNQAFNPQLIDYSQAYENSLHFSPKFQSYAESLSQDLVARHGLKGKVALEIGCGKGDFLSILCRAGLELGTGFDESFEEQALEGEELADRITVFREHYSKKHSHIPADLVCCRHVLEHIQEPVSFLKNIREILTGKNPVFFFEVPNMMYTLRDMGIWDLIYEHCGYFTEQSLCKAFDLAGFKVLDLYETFGGQFLCIEAVHHGNKGLSLPLKNSIASYSTGFSDQYREKVREWTIFLEQSRQNGSRVAVWGAGSKGITFLNLFKPFQDVLGCITDINNRKQGRFTPGTGHEVVSEKALKTYDPDVVLVMNPNYLEEIVEMLANLDISARVIRV